MENQKVKNEILCQQLQLLAERSAKLSIDDLVKISIAMAKISAEITVTDDTKSILYFHRFRCKNL